MTYANGAATVHTVRLLTTTITDMKSGAVQPMWTLELDRASAMQLSSKASFRACEEALNEGYRTCSLGISPCMQLTVGDRAVTIQLMMFPSQCGGEASEPLRWFIAGEGREPLRVPVVASP